MSLDISMAIEHGEDLMMMFNEASVLNGDQHAILTMTLYDSLNEIHKAQDLQEANARKTKVGEEASKANKAVYHDEIETSLGGMNDIDTIEALPEVPKSPAVNHIVDWAGLFYEGEEDTFAEDQKSFTEHETSSADEKVSSTNRTASPHTPSDSNGIALESSDHCIINEEDGEDAAKAMQSYENFEDTPKTLDEKFEHAWKEFEERLEESKTRDEIGPLSKKGIKFLDESPFLVSPPSLPTTSHTVEIQNPVQHVEKPVHRVEQPIRQVETPVHQVDVLHQVEQTISQVQPDYQAQSLRAKEQIVLPALPVTRPASQKLSRTASVGSLTLPTIAASDPFPLDNPHVEQNFHQMHPPHATKLLPGQIHLPLYQPQQASQIRQPDLNAPQNKPDPQQRTKNTQGRAKRAGRVSKTVTKSAQLTMFVDGQDVETSHTPQKVVTEFQYHGEPEMMNGVQARDSNEYSYVVPEGQSEQGLAAFFGLTLDQVKAGMRNKKIGVRNTMIEKPKPTVTHSLLKYAGVRKSKSPKTKLAISPFHVQTGEGKTDSGPISPVKQLIDKPQFTTPVKKMSPSFLTEEQFLEIKKVAQKKAQEIAQETAKNVYCEELKEGIRKAQQMAYQSAFYQQQAPFASPDQVTQLNPFYLQQSAPQTVQYHHAHQTAHYPLQQHVQQAVDYMSSMHGYHTTPSNLQQQVAQMTPGQSPMQGNRAPSYNTPRIASTVPHYSLMQGNQAGSYPSPQATQMAPPNTPHRVGQISSYISPTQPTQVTGYQSLPAHQVADFNIPQKPPQMGAYPSVQQTSQFAQQGHHAQPPASHLQLQQPQQLGRYYAPLPTQQPLGYPPQYDPQNQAQVVAQQYRMQQIQQVQQSGMQYQPNLQDNLRNSAAMAAQANAANPRPQLRVEDFLP